MYLLKIKEIHQNSSNKSCESNSKANFATHKKLSSNIEWLVARRNVSFSKSIKNNIWGHFKMENIIYTNYRYIRSNISMMQI